MALPKALLCVLGAQTTAEAPEEVLLRASGFATATVLWKEVAAQRGWMQLVPILNDPAVQAWIFSGHPADFDDELLGRISMLTLALTRPAPPVTACVLTGSGEEPALPDVLGHLKIFHGNSPFAAKLAAARMKPPPSLPRPFHVAAHLDSLTGQWLELGPLTDGCWTGFMAGVVEAELVAFGIGPRGVLPQKSTLNYPQCGIQGDWGGYPFSACAARNELGADQACYIRVEGCPRVLFITDYPDDTQEKGDGQRVLSLDLY
jgi:hypothetical protein